MKRDKNGFTLIELLAVIVVLAIIILFAMPAVTNSTERAKRGTFASEAAEIIRVADETKTELSMSGASYVKTCLPIRGMVAAGFLSKNVGNLSDTGAYQGSVLIDVTSGVASYTIWLEDGSYRINSGGTAFTSKNVTTGGYTTNSNKCGGTSGATVPAELNKDVQYTTDANGKTTVQVVSKTW